MSTSYNCGLMVGLMYDDVIENMTIDEEDLEELFDDGTLDIASYCYDSARDENVVGFWVNNPNNKRELDLADMLFRIETLSKDFEKLLGIKPKLFNTLFVY